MSYSEDYQNVKETISLPPSRLCMKMGVINMS